ncbi:hypothetical protein ACIPW4_25575 [Pseudomonas sp. NPDC089996]|uniref:hypothetical protein n=1 Tax=Pseudomonas sp. NPDC089996 TaxID=3364474 RepID=UPI0038159EB4
MSDQAFVDAVFSELFSEHFYHYKDALARPVDGGQDAYARAGNALALLSAGQRDDVVEFLKVVIADSASVILGTLDGVHFPGDLEGECIVRLDGEEIQGDLQDMFIQKAQDHGIYN